MGRIYINAIRVINNIKTFGWRNTCAKLKKYLHLGSNYVDYNKWMHSHRLTDSERQEQCDGILNIIRSLAFWCHYMRAIVTFCVR